LREHARAGEGVEQGALARVRVADDRHHGHVDLLAAPASFGALPLELRELSLQPIQPLAGSPPADLEGGLAGTPTADAAGEAAERVVPLSQARQRVLELRQLHLQLAVPGLRSLSEDVQDELTAVDHLEVRVGG